jgi:hypothetical protein
MMEEVISFPPDVRVVVMAPLFFFQWSQWLQSMRLLLLDVQDASGDILVIFG